MYVLLAIIFSVIFHNDALSTKRELSFPLHNASAIFSPISHLVQKLIPSILLQATTNKNLDSYNQIKPLEELKSAFITCQKSLSGHTLITNNFNSLPIHLAAKNTEADLFLELLVKEELNLCDLIQLLGLFEELSYNPALTYGNNSNYQYAIYNHPNYSDFAGRMPVLVIKDMSLQKQNTITKRD